MDLAKINYFFEAVRLKNFTRAAQKCHIAQTTMTKYITQLERQLGCRLFVREHRGVVLTDEGQRFYEGMRKICREYKDLCDSLRQRPYQGLYLGLAMQSYIETLWLQRFEERFPDCKIYFSFQPIEILEKSLERGMLDGFIFSDAQSLSRDFACRRLFDIRQSFICAKSLLERYGSIAGIVAHCPFVTKSNSPSYIARMRRLCRQVFQEEFRDTKICPSLSEQFLAVGLSQGFAVLSMPEGDVYPGLSVMPLSGAFTEHAVLAYRQDGMTEELKQFLTLLDRMPELAQGHAAEDAGRAEPLQEGQAFPEEKRR